MKVLHVVDSLAPHMGGTARAPLDICAGMAERGDDVLLVSTVTALEDVSYLAQEYKQVPIRLFTRRFPRHNFRSPSLRRWLAANVGRYDLVEIHGVFSFVPLYAAWACTRSGTPYTVRPHGSLDPYDLQKHTVAKRILGPWVFRPFLQCARGLILTSKAEADRLVTFGARTQKFVAPLPVCPAAHRGDGKAFRASRGIPVNATVVLFLGRIHPKKGLELLIPSLASLKQSFPELWFLLVGAGEPKHLREVEALLREHGLAPWTTRCEFLSGPAKQAAFASSDVFALPSFNENFGIAVVEAMYCGLPVLISTEVYIHDVVAAGNAGTVCETTLDSCRAALVQLLADEALRRRMGVRGPVVAREHFSQHRAVQILDEVYRELLRGHKVAREDQ